MFVERSIYEPFVEEVRRRDEETCRRRSGNPRRNWVRSFPPGNGRVWRNSCRRPQAGERSPAAAAAQTPKAFISSRPSFDLAKDERCWREEILGLVVAIAPFDEETQMLRDVNASPYGLSGSLWTNDLRRALRVSRAVQSGVLSVNSHSSVHVEAPFGGFKTSGIGRDLGMNAMEGYTELKNVYVAE
jgi:acyl-CoA reductase-like NAD-dependent aldehyde dehydrogenase